MIKRPIFLVINSQLFLLYNFSKFLCIFTLFIHPSTLNITNKTPHNPDDGSAEPKRYSVDWLCFSINPYFLFGFFIVNFSSQIVGLLSIIFFHICIYIYIYIYAHIYIVIHRQTVSLYLNSSGWQEMQDASSWDRNPSNFTQGMVSNNPTFSVTYVKVRNYNAYILAFVYLHFALSDTRVFNSFEELCITSVYKYMGKL